MACLENYVLSFEVSYIFKRICLLTYDLNTGLTYANLGRDPWTPAYGTEKFDSLAHSDLAPPSTVISDDS